MPESESRALGALREIFESARPLAYVRSSEERRVGKLLREAAARYLPGQAAVFRWTLTEGLRGKDGIAVPAADGPLGALDFIAAHEGPAIFHLRDFHEPMQDPVIRRRLRDLYALCFGKEKYVVVSSPVRVLPDDIARDFWYHDLALPDVLELAAFVRETARKLAAGGTAVDESEETIDQLARSLQGLTLDEARHAIRRALSSSKSLGPDSIPSLLEEKQLLIRRSGTVEYVAGAEDIEAVGGHGSLKRWLMQRRKLFQMRDEVSAEIVPKGLLVMGVSGCGKSLCVKAVASCFDLPLYRIDMTAVFSGRYGKPETAFVDACRMLE